VLDGDVAAPRQEQAQLVLVRHRALGDDVFDDRAKILCIAENGPRYPIFIPNQIFNAIGCLCRSENRDDAPLVTRNVKDFSRVPGLRVLGY